MRLDPQRLVSCWSRAPVVRFNAADERNFLARGDELLRDFEC
jgi:hypothetical protein